MPGDAVKYLIWSIEHDAWWAPQERGYTRSLVEAGIYDVADAQRIVAKANRVDFNECLIPKDCVSVWTEVEHDAGSGGDTR